MKARLSIFAVATCLFFSTGVILNVFAADKLFRAGASLIDISPTNFPVIVNGMFTERSATNTADPLYVRSLVLDDGNTRIAIAVVDTCMMSQDLIG